MINSSPCLGCQNEQEYKDNRFDSEKQCMKSCVTLACHQKAISKAEMIGEPPPGVCAICRRPGEHMYCDTCRATVADEIARRLKPAPLPKRNFGPKTDKSLPRHYQWIIKRKKSAKCEICGKICPAEKPAMARNMSKVRGNYRYIHVECFEEMEKAKEAA